VFDTVLVADRGLGARRVVRTCQRLGSRAVTVHTSADAGAAHARDADESLLLGDDQVGDYVDAAKLLEAAGQAAAQAVHPGGGPAAHVEEIARAVVEAGLVWLGPSLAALEARPVSRPDIAGRRLQVHLLAGPDGVRVLADSTDHDGTGLAVCPVPHLEAEQRHAVHQAAAHAVAGMSLTGLATVAVALTPAPVAVAVHPSMTHLDPLVELVTGLDLVEQQLRLADGEPLPEVQVSGAAALTAVHAAGAGVLTTWSPPTGDDVRVDSAVEQGDTPPYDGLLATLAVHAPDPRAAVARLHEARAQWVVDGVPLAQGVRSGA